MVNSYGWYPNDERFPLSALTNTRGPRLYRRVRIRVRAGEKEVRAYAYEWVRSA